MSDNNVDAKLWKAECYLKEIAIEQCAQNKWKYAISLEPTVTCKCEAEEAKDAIFFLEDKAPQFDVTENYGSVKSCAALAVSQDSRFDVSHCLDGIGIDALLELKRGHQKLRVWLNDKKIDHIDVI